MAWKTRVQGKMGVQWCRKKRWMRVQWYQTKRWMRVFLNQARSPRMRFQCSKPGWCQWDFRGTHSRHDIVWHFAWGFSTKKAYWGMFTCLWVLLPIRILFKFLYCFNTFKRTVIKQTVNILIDPSINCCVYQWHNAHLVLADLIAKILIQYSFIVNICHRLAFKNHCSIMWE